MFEIIIIMIFIVGYAAIAMEQKVRVNKTATALLAAVACWALLAIKEAQAPVGSVVGVVESFGHHLEGTAQIVFFLVGAMTIVQLMETHGGFQVVANAIKTKDKRMLLWAVAFMTFFLSAILDNLTTAIVMVSLYHRLIDNKEDRLIFGSMVIIAANAGGAWTPIGDITTTMLWIGGRISTMRIMGTLFIPSMVAMLVPLAYFTFIMKEGSVRIAAKISEGPQPGAKRVFYIGLGALAFVPVFKSLTGLPPVVGMLLGLGALWLLTDLMHEDRREHLTVPKVLAKIDLTSALFFLGILLTISALETAGILAQLATWMDQRFGNKDIIVTVIGLASAIVDNVPLTAATMGMYDLLRYPMDSKLWEFLAYAVGTGGSILVIGSAAGVVVMGMEKIDFMWYFRRISLPALLGYFSGIAAYLIIYSFIS